MYGNRTVQQGPTEQGLNQKGPQIQLTHCLWYRSSQGTDFNVPEIGSPAERTSNVHGSSCSEGLRSQSVYEARRLPARAEKGRSHSGAVLPPRLGTKRMRKARIRIKRPK